MREQTSYTNFAFYQDADADATMVKENFLARRSEYEIIKDDLLRHSGNRSVQHYLLKGKRGSGKSILLRRLQVEIETNEQLMSSYIAINLAEEQANIYRLFDLLEEIVRELEYREIEVEKIEESQDEAVYARQLFYVIHQALKKAGKKLVLLLDNIDRIFENLEDDLSRLRQDLQNYGDIKIIGSCIRVTEHFWAYDKPFYDFFRVMEIRPLNREEVKALLLHWDSKVQGHTVRDFVERRPGQLETIRILTDGLPRTLRYFADLLLINNRGTGYEYLRLLMDKVTPLYRERLNHLPPSQRKIVVQMAFAWEAAGAKELARATRMENRLISAQLSQLIDKGVAEKIETSTKNHLYRLSERFFNLWLIFTQGSQRERRRARYLSIFLDNFYDGKELSRDDEHEPGSTYWRFLSFYEKNENKNEVASFLGSEKSDEFTVKASGLRTVLKAWCGDFSNLEEDVFQLIRQGNPDLNFILTHLLIHHQVDLVYRVFTSDESGAQLVEQLLPLYYATRLLLPDAGSFSIKIPPEIMETVSALLFSIDQKRDIYYHTGKDTR